MPAQPKYDYLFLVDACKTSEQRAMLAVLLATAALTEAREHTTGYVERMLAYRVAVNRIDELQKAS